MPAANLERARRGRTPQANLRFRPVTGKIEPVPRCQLQRHKAIFGRLTQRLECHPHTVEVTGSNPVPPIPRSSENAFCEAFSDDSGGILCAIPRKIPSRPPPAVTSFNPEPAATAPPSHLPSPAHPIAKRCKNHRHVRHSPGNPLRPLYRVPPVPGPRAASFNPEPAATAPPRCLPTPVHATANLCKNQRHVRHSPGNPLSTLPRVPVKYRPATRVPGTGPHR